MKPVATALAAVALLAAAGCRQEPAATKPAAVALSAEALGHYCQMTVLDHPGPKAQIHLAGNPHPLWFSQVRDAVTFTLLPEEPRNIAAIYVNDMEGADWADPGANNWIDAEQAHFVIDSRVGGGMGAPEAIPFGTRAAADAFAAAQGGRILRFAEIPEDYVLAPAPSSAGPAGHDGDMAGVRP